MPTALSMKANLKTETAAGRGGRAGLTVLMTGEWIRMPSMRRACLFTLMGKAGGALQQRTGSLCGHSSLPRRLCLQGRTEIEGGKPKPKGGRLPLPVLQAGRNLL